MSPATPIRAVVFDVGETLIDESRIWLAWADWLGIPPLTFLAVLGAAIQDRAHHWEPFQLFRPGIDVRAEARRRREAGRPDDAIPADLYPDAVDALRAVRAAGYLVGVAGNQPSSIEPLFEQLGVELDLVSSSGSLGVEKPDPAFFAAIAAALGVAPAEVAYVGDRVDNDVRPAAAAGMRAIFLRRGPWAWIQEGRSVPPEADATIEDLRSIVEVVRGLD